MALSQLVRGLPAQSIGAVKMSVGTLTGDSSYTTGGYAFDVRGVGLNQLLFLILSSGQGVLAKWDGSVTAPKILFYEDKAAAAATPLGESGAADNLSTITVEFMAIGY